MKSRCNFPNNNNFQYLQGADIKELDDNSLKDEIQSTHIFLKTCEIYLDSVKDDYGKKKIASLRLAFVKHQLDLLIRECLARENSHNPKNFQK